MHRTILLLLLCIALFAATPTQAAFQVDETEEAPHKYALVIGNSEYTNSPLSNPVHDAEDIGKALTKSGFSVDLIKNGTRREMVRGVRSLSEKLAKGGVGLFYYAGHGMQVEGHNYLLPVDADIRTAVDVQFEAVSADRILGYLEQAGNRMNIIILDACRNNPFARSFRSSEQGLARMDAPTGSLMAYATAPGSVAADGAGRNGIYTKHLLQAMGTPGLNINEVFMQVRKGVLAETDGRQTPWESSSLIGRFYFTPAIKRPTPVQDERTARLERELTEMREAMTKLQEQKPVQQVTIKPDPKTEQLEQELAAMRDEMTRLRATASAPTPADDNEELEAELAAMRAQMAKMQQAMATPAPSRANQAPIQRTVVSTSPSGIFLSNSGDLRTAADPARTQAEAAKDAGGRFVYSLAPFPDFLMKSMSHSHACRITITELLKRQDMRLVFSPISGFDGATPYTITESLTENLWKNGKVHGPDATVMARIADFLQADRLVTLAREDGSNRDIYAFYIYERQTGEMHRYKNGFTVTSRNVPLDFAIRKLTAHAMGEFNDR